MHLVHPSLSTTGKKRGKTKFRNADEARRARELEKDWNDLQKKWESGKQVSTPKNEKLSYKLSAPAGRETSNHIPSRGNGIGTAALAPAKMYSGDKVMGVTIVHKSCLQPVFNQQEAVDAARMRR
jgi:hypothetical protein